MCTYNEQQLTIPPKFTNATIIFEKPVYYWTGAEDTCRSDIQGSIWAFNEHDILSSDMKIIPIANSEKFKIVEYDYVSCKIPLLCLDSGNPGKTVILQGSDGKKWVWAGVKVSYPKSVESQFLDGAYYMNGQRIDFVRSEDFPSP